MRIVVVTAALFLAFSCGRIRQKGHVVVEAARTKVQEKKEQLADKMSPAFDANTPDTKANKKRFREFFGFDPGVDVRNLYCYDGGVIPLESSYYFGFECKDSTTQRLIDSLHLKKPGQTLGFGGGMFSDPFSWWDTAFINNQQPLSRVEDNRHWNLWYDPSAGKAYIFTYTH